MEREKTDVKAIKDELERKILDLVKEFEDTTGTEVIGMYLNIDWVAKKKTITISMSV